MDNLARKGVDTKDIAARANDPIRFTLPDRNTPASGYEATLLEDICAVVIDAHSRGALDARQAHVGEHDCSCRAGRAGVVCMAQAACA